MPDADELKGCHPLAWVDLRERALYCIAAGEQLLADVVGAVLAKLPERRRVVPAFGQAVPAVAEGVRALRQAPIAAVALRCRLRRRDRADLGQLDGGLVIEDQATVVAPHDLADVLCAVVQADADAFTGAHRGEDAQDHAVWLLTGRRRRRPTPAGTCFRRARPRRSPW